MKPAALRELSEAELLAKGKELEESLFRNRLQKAIGQLPDPLKMRKTRREIARVKTILKEKSAAQAASK